MNNIQELSLIKKLGFIIVLTGVFFNGFAQNDTLIPEKIQHKPVISPWYTTTFIDNQTTAVTAEGRLEMVIQHRFTAIDNGITDLFGFYGASNIRLGLNYGITDNFMVGFGSEKDKKMQEFLAKYNILEQSKDNAVPVSVAVFANTCINAREKEYWGTGYKFTDRLSYFSQVIVSRKWTNNFATMLGIGYAHVNKVDSYRVVTEDSVSETIAYYPKYYNDAMGIAISARYKITGAFSLISEFEKPFAIGKTGNNSETTAQIEAKPDFAFGFEITTMSHSFQLFASSYRGIVPQNNLIMNNYDFTDKSGIMLGFNVLVKF